MPPTDHIAGAMSDEKNKDKALSQRNGHRAASRGEGRGQGRPPQGEERFCAICSISLRPGEDAICQRCLGESEERQKKIRQKPIGAARTPFGTRVSTAIVCAECGKHDHVSFRPKKGARTLCRSCAEKLLGQYESGSIPRPEMTQFTCAHCGRQAELPSKMVQEGQSMLCSDCFNGIYSYQGERSRTGERRASGVILSRRKKARAADKVEPQQDERTTEAAPDATQADKQNE